MSVRSRAQRSLEAGRARLVSAGLLDAGMASLATFVVSLYAVRFLEPDQLGAYGIFFTAFVFASFVPAAVYFLPSRISALDTEQRERVGILPRTLRVGGLIAAAAAACTPIAGIAALGQLPLTDIGPLAVTTAGVVCVSSLQDHMRATFHISGLPWHAAAVSAIQLGAIATILFLMHSLSTAPQWIPFGSLALANCVSLAAGLCLARHGLRVLPPALPTTRHLLKMGRSLLVLWIVPHATRLIASGLVASFRSIDAVGYAEAARVVASPIPVAAVGLEVALTSPLMEAGRTRSRRASRNARIWFLLALMPAAVCYAVIVASNAVVNPMPHLVPTAYELDGLVLLSLAAVIAAAGGSPFRTEVLGARKGHQLVRAAIYSSVLHLLVVGTAMWTMGAYAIPLGLAVAGLVTSVAAWRYAEKLYLVVDAGDPEQRKRRSASPR